MNSIYRLAFLIFFILYGVVSKGQEVISFENYTFWTGLQPDTVAGGLLEFVSPTGPEYPNGTDGVIGSTISSPQLIGRRSCADTLYRVYASIDVTNNPNVSFDAATSLTRSDGFGNLQLVWDNGFVEGEENKVTVFFDFEQEIFGQSPEPISGGLSFPLDNFAAGNPGEVANIRVYNGASLIIEDIGITNSNNCSPLPDDGTTNGVKHFIEVPVGQLFTRIEIDLYLCQPSTSSFAIEFEEPYILNAACNPSVPLGDCGPGYGYYLMSLDPKSNIRINTNESKGFLYGGVSFDVDQIKIDAPDSLIPDNFIAIEDLDYSKINTSDFESVTNLTLQNGSFEWNWLQSISKADTVIRTIDFCSSVDNLILYLERYRTNNGFQIFDCDGQPIPLRWIGVDFSVSEQVTGYADGNEFRLTPGGNGNAMSNLAGSTPSDQEALAVEIVGTYDCLTFKMFSDLETNFNQGSGNNATNVFEAILLDCGPLQVEGECNYDLYVWKSDTTVHQYVLNQAGSGNFYELLDDNFNAASIGDMIFLDAPACGSLSLLHRDAVSSCPDDFGCPGGGGGSNVAVKIETVELNGTGHFLDQHWQDEDPDADPVTALGVTDRPAYPSGSDIMGSQWHDSIGPFAGPIDIFGLPTYGAFGVSSSISPLDSDAQFGGIGTELVVFGNNTINSYQHDGWLAVPPGFESVEFMLKNNNNGTGALYAIEQDGSHTEIFDESWAGSNGARTDDSYGIYCIDNPHTIFGAGWKLIRLRLYIHNYGSVLTKLEWKMPESLTKAQTNYRNDFDPIPDNFVWPAESPTSLIVPTNLLEDTISVRYAIADNDGVLWEPNGSLMPTTKLDLTYSTFSYNHETIITDCNGQPSPTIGSFSCTDAISADFCQEVTTCEEVIANNVNICELLALNPNNPLANEDCDQGGQINSEECAENNDPSNDIDDSLPACDPSTPAPIISTNGSF